jgi:isorenieratene synthase
MKKSLIDRIVEKRLGGYKQLINRIDDSLPTDLQIPKSVAVIGAGLGGLSTASVLADRGFNVTLFEKNNFLGGKVGSWEVTLNNGFSTQVEHGFHAFFRQYYNLRRLLDTWQVTQYLKPIDDYLIATQEQDRFSFKDIRTTPLVNMLSLARKKVYRLGDMMKNPKSSRLLDLLRYDPQNTFERYDHVSFQEFADQIQLPGNLRLVFYTFARAFFAEPKNMSTAEMIKSFHFYFLSNDLGLVYDVLDDDFSVTLLGPVERYLRQRGVSIRLSTPVERLQYHGNGYSVTSSESTGDDRYDYCVLAADVPGAKAIAGFSEFIAAKDPRLDRQLQKLQASQHYAVLRLWLDRDVDEDLPFFIFTDRVKILDSISLYHRMENSSAEWARRGGGIFELHSYALPDDFDTEQARDQFLEEFWTYLPSLKGAAIEHEYLQVRNDFTAFHTGLQADRPAYSTAVPGLFLAADWVKLPQPAMLMEAAATAGILSANAILQEQRLRQEPVFSVPRRGMFSPSKS